MWVNALENILPRGCPQHWLGRLIDLGHKVSPDPQLTIDAVRPEAPPTLFWEVLQKWERTWMWENIQWVEHDNWIAEAIEDGSCIAVTDGSYMKALHLQIHSAAFVLECSKGRGWLWGSFSEASQSACSYRGELVGLMAIYLILLAINEVNTNLTDSVHIFLDCLGALDKVKNLPPL